MNINGSDSFRFFLVRPTILHSFLSNEYGKCNTNRRVAAYVIRDFVIMENPPLTQEQIDDIDRILVEDYEMLVVLS